MKKYDNTNMLLRYYIGLENHEKRFELLVDFLNRTGIHRVLLFSAPFSTMSSIIPESYYQKHVDMLRPYVEKLREMNVEVGVNVLYTLGHCFYPDEEEFGFKRAVTIDGEASRGCVCPLDTVVAACTSVFSRRSLSPSARRIPVWVRVKVLWKVG